MVRKCLKKGRHEFGPYRNVIYILGTHNELMRKEGLYHSLVMAQISSEDEMAERAEEDDIVEDLEFVEHSMPSLVSLTSHNGGVNIFFNKC